MANSSKPEFQTSVYGLMLKAPAGAFMMGSPESEDGHRVWEAQRNIAFKCDFFLGQSPVTQREFEAVMGTNPSVHEKIPDAPVDSVNWRQATEFCQKLTRKDRDAGVIAEDWAYRLPTEAEWEYACRAGNLESRYGPVDDVAWHFGNADMRPHAVGQKAPNAWGFHDMLGNVWECCQDWFWTANPARSVRGGSYFNSARCCRAAQRWGWMPNNRGRYCGFRLLAAPNDSLELSPPVDDFPAQKRPPSIFDAIEAQDFELGLRIITEDPMAIESPDTIPPPLHGCIYSDQPEAVEWLLDHGADIERREQDYGATPLITAVVMRRKRIIRILVERGADSREAMDHARRGSEGAFEDDPQLDRAGYQEVVELLRELGVNK